MVKFGFVILHYMAESMTKECVENILKYKNDDIHIVIMDNNSSNRSGKNLRNFYKGDQKVTVLLNNANLGFAQGNNIGYLYLKANYSCDFIIIMNNDVLITQLDFLKIIANIYKREKFAVLGPDVYSPNANDHQNPLWKANKEWVCGLPYEQVLKMHKNLKKGIEHAFYYRLRGFVGRCIRKFLYIRRSILEDKSLKQIPTQMENVVLHGSCYIFSQDFINKRRLAFNPDTFLYFEEDILHKECMQLGLKMLYSSELHVNHMEDVSTNMAIKHKYKRQMMKNRNLYKSTGVFLELGK